MIKNISENGTNLELRKGFKYLIIDALYLEEIKENLNIQKNLNFDELKKQIKEKVFPFNDTPFAEFYMKENQFRIETIKKMNNNNKISLEKQFSSDTGLVLLFTVSNFRFVLENFDYEKFTDSQLTLVNHNYWSNLIGVLEENTIGTIIAPGVNSGYDFEGGGTYCVNI